jgi:hypothetical protein
MRTSCVVVVDNGDRGAIRDACTRNCGYLGLVEHIAHDRWADSRRNEAMRFARPRMS